MKLELLLVDLVLLLGRIKLDLGGGMQQESKALVDTKKYEKNIPFPLPDWTFPGFFNGLADHTSSKLWPVSSQWQLIEELFSIHIKLP